MAVDPEVADDVLVARPTRTPVVVRLVEGRIDVHQIAHAAADNRHVILDSSGCLRSRAAGRAGARRQQFVWNPAELCNQLIDRMRPLLDQRLVGSYPDAACRYRPARYPTDVYRECAFAAGATAPLRRAGDPTSVSTSSESSALITSGHVRVPYNEPPWSRSPSPQALQGRCAPARAACPAGALPRSVQKRLQQSIFDAHDRCRVELMRHFDDRHDGIATGWLRARSTAASMCSPRRSGEVG